MKRTLSVILAVLMLLTALPFAAVPAAAETFGDFKYEILDDGTVEITGYTGSATDLTIPNKIDNKPVRHNYYTETFTCVFRRSMVK